MWGLYLFLFAALLFGSCKPNRKYGIVKGEPVAIIMGMNSAEYQLENIMRVHKVVSLEANSDSYIVQIEKIIEYDHKLFILDELANKLLVFSEDGSFLHSVGKKGPGPGEFQNIVDFDLHIEKKQLYILDIDKRAIFKYDIDGRFISEFRLPFQGYRFSIHQNRMAFYTGYFDEESSNLIITDLNGVVVDRLFKFDPNNQLMKFNFTGGITSNKSGFLYSDAASNNIYQIDDKGITVKYRVDFGYRMWPEEDRMRHEDFFSAVRKGELNFLRKDYEETESAIVFEYNQYDEKKVETKFTNNPRIGFFSKKHAITFTSENFPDNVLYTVISGPKGVMKNDLFISFLDVSRLANDMQKVTKLSEILHDQFNITNNILDSDNNPLLVIYEIL
jgi:hypothetical protein